MLPLGTRIVVNLSRLNAPEPGGFYAELPHRWLSSQIAGELVLADCVATRHGESYYYDVFPNDRHIDMVSWYHGLSIYDARGLLLRGSLFYQYGKYEQKAGEYKTGLWQLVETSDPMVTIDDY